LSVRGFVAVAVEADLGLKAVLTSNQLGDELLRAVRWRYLPKLTPVVDSSRDELGRRAETLGVGLEWTTGWGFNLSGDAVWSRPAQDTGEVELAREAVVELAVPIGADSGTLGVRIEQKEAEQFAQKERRAVRDAQVGTIFRALELFYRSLAAEKEREVSEESIKSATRAFELSEMKYQLGEISRLDLDRARQQLHQTRAALLASKLTREQIRMTVWSSYGVEASRFERELPDQSLLNLPWTAVEAADLLIAVDSELANLRGELVVEQLRYRYLRRRLWPALEFVFRSGSRTFRGADQSIGRGISEVGLTADLSLDYAERLLAISVAQRRIARLRVDIEARTRFLTSRIANELDYLSRLLEWVALWESSLATARAQEEVAEARYRRGIGSLFDLVDAQSQVREAEGQLIRSRVETVLSYYGILATLKLLNEEELL
jgi:outer membrane protein